MRGKNVSTRFSRRNFLTASAASAAAAAVTPAVAQDRAPEESRPKFKVLSLDGGGVRGYLTAGILVNIEKHLDTRTKTKLPLGRRFDLIAGTSAGGIIGLGLATDRSAVEILDFYEKLVPEVFNPKNTNWTPQFQPKYKSDPLRSALRKLFQNATLADVTTDVCITGVDLAKGEPRFHKSLYLAENRGRLDEKLSEIALATSAAPTYFEAHSLKYSSNLVDGGICANNPSVIALVEALRFEEKTSRHGTPKADRLADIALVSVGTGQLATMPYDAPSLAKGGLLDWARYISDVMFESQSWVTHHQTRFLLKEHYRRFNPRLKFTMLLDDAGRYRDLRNYWDIGTDDQQFLNRYWPQA